MKKLALAIVIILGLVASTALTADDAYAWGCYRGFCPPVVKCVTPVVVCPPVWCAPVYRVPVCRPVCPRPARWCW